MASPRSISGAGGSRISLSRAIGGSRGAASRSAGTHLVSEHSWRRGASGSAESSRRPEREREESPRRRTMRDCGVARIGAAPALTDLGYPAIRPASYVFTLLPAASVYYTPPSPPGGGDRAPKKPRGQSMAARSVSAGSRWMRKRRESARGRRGSAMFFGCRWCNSGI